MQIVVPHKPQKLSYERVRLVQLFRGVHYSAPVL